MKKIEFNALGGGPDQKHTDFQRAKQWCHEHGKEVVMMPRAEGISSTLLKKQFNNQEGEAGSEITLNQLKVIQMDILEAIDEFCNEQNIRYSLACGTLLGAIRHKGYIPWDDDIDIYLPRTDYNRLISTFPQEYKGRYKISSLERDSEWERPYAKAYDNRTLLHEKVLMKRMIGVNIDIFPIDEVPDDEYEWKRYDRKRRLVQKLFWMKYVPASQGRSIFKKIAIFLFQVVTFFVNKRKCAYRLDKIAQQYNGSGYKRYFECCQGISQKNPFPKSLFDKIICIPFEDRRFKAFSNSNIYLKNAYGDYMKLPPEEKRVSNHNIRAYWK